MSFPNAISCLEINYTSLDCLPGLNKAIVLNGGSSREISITRDYKAASIEFHHNSARMSLKCMQTDRHGNRATKTRG